jgi:predicted HTH domain antitoxin
MEQIRSIGMEHIRVSFDLPREILAVTRQDPASFTRELRLAAAAKWYEVGLVSQDKAAEVAGLSRSEFLAALARFQVTPFQYSAEEIIQESIDNG